MTGNARPSDGRPHTNYLKGHALAALGTIALAFDAVLIRLADVSAWNAAFWRGCLIAVALTLYLLAARQLGSFKLLLRYRLLAVSICLLYGFNTALFVFALSYTSVANTVVILCCTPFAAAFFSRWILQESTDNGVWWTVLLAVLGVILVFAGSLKVGAWRGDLMALLLALTTGLLLTLLRRYPDFPRIAAIALGAALSVPLLSPFSAPLSLSMASFAWLAIMGLLQKPIASICLLSATRYLPSPEVGLFLVVETLLAPGLVWLLLDERVATSTLVGGIFVVSAMSLHSMREILWARHERKI